MKLKAPALAIQIRTARFILRKTPVLAGSASCSTQERIARFVSLQPSKTLISKMNHAVRSCRTNHVLRLRFVLSLAILFGWVWLCAIDHTPGQLLFKTTSAIQIQRGKTGLTSFDTYLSTLRATNLVQIKGMQGKWFKADVASSPDWEAIRSKTLVFDGIEIIQPNYLNKLHVVPNDPWYSRQQHALVELPEAWNYTVGSPLVLVGVVDSGILRDHPDLQANIYNNSGEIPGNGSDDDHNGYIDDYSGWDFADAPELVDIGLGDYTGQDNDVTDENFHGTHVAGIIGASSNNGIGIAGVCWNVKILPIRAGFRTTGGAGYLQDDDAAAAVIYGADMGCSVINMSWGDANYSPIIADACQYAYDKGVVLVASAGNDPGPYLSYPAKLSCVISVGAVDQFKNLAGFSSYGPELDLVAPGQQIYSTYKLTEPDVYKEQSGTSMSSPYVAGGVALLKSILPNLTPDEVRSRLLTATDDLGPIGYDTQYGHGLMNVRKLIENTNPPQVSVTFPPDHIGVSEDFDIIGTLMSEDFFRYSVMYTTEDTPSMLDWYDVEAHTNEPVYHYTTVNNNVLAHFYMPDLLAEGSYLIRIQMENSLGAKYNYFRTVLIDRTPPTMQANTFGVIKRYDGQNIRFYAGALFSEPVRAELKIYAGNADPVSCFAVKMDTLQVWTLPNSIPSGTINVEIIAKNNSNLIFHSAMLTNVADIQYEIIPNYGFTSSELLSPLVPMNRRFDYDVNGVDEFVAMNLPTSGYGTVKIYEPANGTLTPKYSFNSSFWPLDIGDTNGIGEELLSLNLDTAYIYETHPDSLYIFRHKWSDTGISGGIIADYGGDNTKDLILVKNLTTERVIQLYKRASNPIFTPKNTLHNTTATSSRNMFVPTVICENLDGDSWPDILTADTDGDIMVFEVYNAGETGAVMTWNHRLPVGNAYYLTTGDFDGNGTKDFFVGGYNKDQVDPSQTYWLFEGFTSDAPNSFHSLGNIQINNVVSQNAIQALDVDNDAKDEIILALSPNLYVLKYLDGQFKPVYYGNSMRTYQIAAWEDNLGNPHFLTNQNNAADSLKTVEWTAQAPFTGPDTPANLQAHPLGANTVQLNWQSTAAGRYQLYRKDYTGIPMMIAEVTSTGYQDNAVVADSTYHYAIAAVDDTMTPSLSILSMWISALPKAQPQITSITMIGANELRVVFDQVMSSGALNIGSYNVDNDIGYPLSVNSVLNQTGIQLRFRTVFTDINEDDGVPDYILSLHNVTGVSGVPVNQSQIPFVFNADYVAPTIETVQVLSNARTVRITLSESIDPAAANPANFELVLTANDPDNSVSAVTLDDDVISVTLAKKLKYSNQPYYLILHDVKDLAGNTIPSHHNTARFVLTDVKHLDKVIVFPNPIHSSQHDGVIFLNFPPDKKGKLYIYTTAGDLVYKSNIGPFNATANDSTCRWELQNQTGGKVSSGIYYYLIEMGKDKARGKIAVIN